MGGITRPLPTAPLQVCLWSLVGRLVNLLLVEQVLAWFYSQWLAYLLVWFRNPNGINSAYLCHVVCTPHHSHFFPLVIVGMQTSPFPPCSTNACMTKLTRTRRALRPSTLFTYWDTFWDSVTLGLFIWWRGSLSGPPPTHRFVRLVKLFLVRGVNGSPSLTSPTWSHLQTSSVLDSSHVARFISISCVVLGQAFFCLKKPYQNLLWRGHTVGRVWGWNLALGPTHHL